MSMKQIRAALLGMCMAMLAPASHAQVQYSTDWLANTYGTLAQHVGNAARSMWVAPEGVIYTSSRWDENAGGVALYQNGQTLGTIGIHDEFQGGAITGNATSIFVALGYNRTFGSGSVGRYDRSTNKRDLRIPVSTWTGLPNPDVITGLATAGNLLYASDFYGNRVRVYTTDGVWQRDIGVTGLARWRSMRRATRVARMSAGVVAQYSATGTLLNTIQMAAGARPSALYFDASTGSCWWATRDMNIKLYSLAGLPQQIGTFGVQGGYLDTTSGIKGRSATALHARGRHRQGFGRQPVRAQQRVGRRLGSRAQRQHRSSFVQPDRRAAMEAAGAELRGDRRARPGDRRHVLLQRQQRLYGPAGGTFVANTVDPFTYPKDPRLDMNDYQRGQHFGQLVMVGGNRILVASGQNPGNFNFYYFTPATGYIANPAGSLPGKPFNTTLQVTTGFDIDGNGDVWAGLNGTNAIPATR